jgi:putative ATP-dependent endonuclease of the OLD family
MLKIIDVSIENYRSILQPLKFTVSDYCVIVGPNNSGKSNILRGLQLFFNGRVDGKEYDTQSDLPKYENLSNSAQTRITVKIEFDPKKDITIHNAMKFLESESGQARLSNNILQLRLEYSRKNKAQWRFFSKAGLRNIRAELVIPVVDAVQNSIRFKYLPVGRNIQETIRTELSDELIRTIFSGWSGAVKARQEINDAISVLFKKLQPRLEVSGAEITEAINGVFEEVKKLELRLPFSDLETMLPSLIPSLHDTHVTPLDQKGAGIQTSTLLFLLKYLADHHPQRHNLRITYVWAIEEPESYLHPSRQKGMANILREFSEEVQTIITTHSPHFVPREKNITSLIIDKDHNPPFSTIEIGSDYELARQTLGVSLLDSMYLYPYNIIVEGPSDEIMLKGAWEKLHEDKRTKIDPVNIRFFPGNGASGACTLYESLITFGDSDEVKICLIIDGDDAGDKALRGLIKRLMPSRPLYGNKNYFQLTKATEWLVSGRVMSKISKQYPAQITLKRNVKEEITDFIIHDGKKKKIAKKVIDTSEIEDLSEFKDLIKSIEKELLA